MDETRFDDLSRSLSAAATRRAGLKAALGALLGGAGVAAASRDADAKRRRRRCRPACGPQQSCVNRQCTCPGGGTVCGANCCLVGQACQGGQCVTLPDPGACVAFGQVCKNVGVPCCEGFVCGSGQGGENDVACYVPAGGACSTTGDCTFGSQCLMGLCVANPQPQPTPIIQCTPSVPVTGDPATDGAALKAAFAAAATETATVIYLASGDYLLAEDLDSEDAVEWNTPGSSVTVQACPNATAVMRATGFGNVFRVTEGSMTFVGPGLSITGETAVSGGTIGVRAALDGSVSFQAVDVTNHFTGIQLAGSSTVVIDGGTVSGIEAFDYKSDATPYPSLTCGTNPAGTGEGVCGSDSTNCPSSGTCGRTWTQNP